PEPDGPHLRHPAPVRTPHGRRGPPATDRPEGLHRCRPALRRDHPPEDARAGLPPAQGRQVQAEKKLPQTDAIFARLSEENEQADASEDTLRLSLDDKASVN